MSEDGRFDITRENSQMIIFFSSTMKNVDRAIDATRIFLKDVGLESETFDVSLVLREGLTNAVRHGNQLVQDKIVQYSIQMHDNRLIAEIEDEGDGFSWKTVKDELMDIFLSESDIWEIDEHEAGTEWRPENKLNFGPKSEHGRGLIIMDQYFNECLYNDKGNRLILIKEL